MPGLGRYPCTTCHYVASNRRMLARHAVLIHSVKSFKCPLCPFITRYAANWYRHKRDQHGLTKLTTCEVCGFFASSTEELAHHKESEHLDLLQLPKYEDKYAKERVKLGAESASELSPSGTAIDFCETVLEEGGDFQEPLLNIDYNEADDFQSSGEILNVDDSITFSLPLNGGLLESEYDILKTESTETSLEGSNNVSSNPNSDSSKLKPLRIRRSYCCDQCGLLTSDPREYLYHCRDVHGERISVHECKWCIYASKHVQKLQRHCNLVHRELVAKENELKKQREAEELELKKKREAEELELKQQREAEELELKKQQEAQDRELRKQLAAQESELRKQLEASTDKSCGLLPSAPNNFTQVYSSKRNIPIFKCNDCSYQTRNKVFMNHHEKTVHSKKKYKCIKCGYGTNDKSRYTKHIKYHNLPKAQCDFCFFKTAYKWNMDRHMRNHVSGVEGAYSCTLCNFTTSSKQSLKLHATNHHDVFMNMNPNQQDMMAFSNDKDYISEPEFVNVCDDDDMFEDSDISAFEKQFSTGEKNAENNWNKPNATKKKLKCSYCDFRATWPFEIKKHEENHRSSKKHECPLCGMRFEHIAWLTKHLNRIHKGHSQVKNITDALEQMKPGRKKPTNLQSVNVLPMFQEVLKQNNAAVNPSQNPTKPSMLSTLLKKPLPANSNRLSPSKQSQSANNFSTQPELSSYLSSSKQPQTSKLRTKSVPTCDVCGYKTRWSSELERHMRVHTHEKPFRCSKCKYHCKWKGDLNRHLMKYHGIKVPPANKKSIIPKLKLKKASSNKSYCASDWETVDQETNHSPVSTSSISATDQDSPLDLRLAKSTFPHPYMKHDILNIYDFEDPMTLPEDIGVALPDPIKQNSRISPSSNASGLNSVEETLGCKRRYKCPFCFFSTSTASRFHVHIVQHYNKRPFMCSLCGYRSNWEWDITKHIRLKGCKDKAHNKACVLLTDETGRRNYDKYEKYLTDVNEEYKFPFAENKSQGATSEHSFETRHSARGEISSSPNKKSCTYDFKNIASNFESDPTDNVTPDLKLKNDYNDIVEDSDPFDPTDFTNEETDTLEKISDYRHYYCKHCNYKNSTKRVVVSHLSIHAGMKPFRCKTCGVTSNWRHVIVRHVKDMHNGNMANIEDRIRYTQEGHGIRLTSVNEGNKTSSTTAYKSSARFGCNICPYTCDKEYYIKFHMKQHKQREGAIYQCSFCPYFVKFKKSLSKHLRLHKSTPFLNESYSEDAYLERCDINEPLNERNPFSSNYDSPFDKTDDSITMSFERLASNEEQTSTPKIKRHICKHCPYTTDNKTQFLYHKQFHRPNPSAPFKCNSCSYWATMQHLLTQHMRVHSESYKDFSTSNFKATLPTSLNVEDAESFATSNTEQISIVYIKRGDLVVKMFKCSHCPMMNKKRANVRVHQRMHGVTVKNGKFACTFCNYQCLNQGGLTNHIKIHQRNKDREMFSNRSEATLNNKFVLSNKLTLPNDEIPIDGLKKGNFSYFCLKCPALFKSPSDFNIHKKFHGSSLPFPCPYCDYKARHKPHLSKHLLVHTVEYAMKRNASQGPPIASDKANPTDFNDITGLKNIAGKKKIDQMLLLEASEVNQSLKMPQDCITKLHTCVFCPASFFKTSTLAYHISLHGSGGEFKCSQCDYSTTRSDNLDMHLKVHPEVIKKLTIKKNVRSYCCPRCPAVFYKQDRYNRHFDLHGKNYRYVCGQCDYSVRFAANLNKHRKVHYNMNQVAPVISTSITDENNENNTLSTNQDATMSTSVQPSLENAKSETDDKKVYYICDRCPYAQNRKDAIQSHQRRHWLNDGVQCLYCDYSSMNTAKLRDHIKLHIHPSQIFFPQAFMKYEKFEIWCKEDKEDIILFEDEFLHKSQNSDTINNVERDFEKSTSRPKISARLETSRVFDSLDEKYLHKSSKQAPARQSSKSSPVVVLSDIFTNHNDLKRFVPESSVSSLKKKLKIKSLQSISSISKEDQLKIRPVNGFINPGEEKKSSDSHHKPNIVVKIKVENCLKDNCEKTTYSVSTKETEHVPDEYKTSKNAQPESETSKDFLDVPKSPNFTRMGNETALTSKKKTDSLVKQTACEQGANTAKESVIPVVIVTDITPDCMESFEVQKNHDSLANGDPLTNLT